MKNLWRIIMFFLLPGMVLGGGWIAAFLHLPDDGLEPLKALTFAGVLWSVLAFAAVKAAHIMHAGRNFYYLTVVFMAVGTTGGVGLVRYIAGSGSIEGWAGIVFAAVAAGGIFYAFSSGSFKHIERWSLVLGILLAGAVWLFACIRIRMSWMETLFFYLGEFLILSWVLASPFTCRGAKISRWVWRCGLFAAAVIAYFFSPVFSCPYYGKAPEYFADGLWVKTWITGNGSRFILMDQNRNSGYFTAAGRALMWRDDDEYLTASLPGLLSVLKTSTPNIQLVASAQSVLPQNLRAITGIRPRHFRVPGSLLVNKNTVRNQSVSMLFDRNPIVSRQDLLLIAALPENQYPAAIRRFAEYFFVGLNPNAVTAVPAHLLKNPALFTFLHEKFAYHSVLSSPGHLWIFSHRPLDLSDKAIEKNLQALYGEDSPVPPGMYSTLTGAQMAIGNENFIIPPEKIQWGGNRWFCAWWWCLIAAGVVILWRFFRLFGERRNIMYSYFNTIETGFGSMGIFLLALALLLTYTGAFILVIAVAALTCGLLLTRFSAGGVWLAIPGALSVPLLVMGSNAGCFWLLPVMAQAVCSAGYQIFAPAGNMVERRKLLEAWHIGFMLAAAAMLAVWLWNIPLLFIWAIFSAARIPGIWQNK